MTWEEITNRPMTREEAIKQLREFIILHQEQHGWDVSTIKALEKAVKALEQNAKYRKEAKRWKNKALGQKQVLDKIREQIGTYYADCSLSISENDEQCKRCTDTVFCSVLQIIDKYIVESEEV